jgi:DUF917 family protein
MDPVTGMMLAKFGTDLVLGGLSARNAEKMARANFKAARQSLRQDAKQVQASANAEAADVIRRANAEMAMVTLAAAEMGASGSSMVRLMADVAGVEAIDRARIAQSRKFAFDSINSQLKAAAAGGGVGQYNANAALITGTIGSGLSLGADMADMKAQRANQAAQLKAAGG